jgi:hypothetical protein
MGTKVADEHYTTIFIVKDGDVMFPEKNNANRNCSENLVCVGIQTYREHIILPKLATQGISISPPPND